MGKKKKKKKKRKTTKGQTKKFDVGYLDMEVFVASAGEEVLLRWLKHMKAGIAKKKGYKRKASFWNNARMRYIYNTTGPYNMMRF